MQAKEQHYYSPEEYLELELAADYKSEYRDGSILPMAGGLPNHNRIAGNLHTALNVSLKGKAYDVFISDMRLWIPRKRLYTYPDVMVVAGQLEFAEGRRDTITNPLMIAEVLSESTENYDRGEKFRAYRTIPTFKEYLLISQTEMRLEQYSKTTERRWTFSEYEGESDVLELVSVPCQVALIDLYDRVRFEESS